MDRPPLRGAAAAVLLPSRVYHTTGFGSITEADARASATSSSSNSGTA